ncbi:MAG: BtrH N-terminal domain-containing protein [Anaerolineae bacterium]|nr:BtrH N-terminal domain-containing protein [Anaerolineae bacterium]
MALKPLAGFKSLETHHCVTGSMRHIYVYNDHDISEDMLLGLGAGVSFSYWHFKGQTPFMGGRGGFRPPYLEEVAGRRTGVKIEFHTTSSARKARETLLEMLDAGQPVMIQCDMGFLPYFDFGDTDYHFGWHVVVVCGYDPETEQVLIADRDKELHPVSMEDLQKARGSTYKPFPPKNKWYTFDFSEKRAPTAAEVREAIVEQVEPMLEPPISNIGVKGIRKAAKMIPQWPNSLDADELRWTLFNSYIFISPVGGTGGGLFRYMFSRFLREAAEIMADPRLNESADEFQRIGDVWEELGEWFRQISEMDDPAPRLGEGVAWLNRLADLEEVAWQRLRDIVC